MNATEKRFQILFVHPEAPKLEENLPPTFEDFNDLIREIFPSLSLQARVKHGYQAVTASNYPQLFHTREDLIELDFEIPLQMFIAEMNTSKRRFDYTEVSLQTPLLFRSKRGFDAESLKTIQDEFSVFGGKKLGEYLPFFMNQVIQPVHTPLREAPIHRCRKPAIVFVKAHGYSYFTVRELSQVVRFQPFDHDVDKALNCYTTSLADVQPLYQTEEAIFQHYLNLNKVTDHCVASLKMIKSCIHDLSEANRRLAINVFVIAVAHLARLSINAEKEFKGYDWAVDPPLGAGPLDYHVDYEGSSVVDHSRKKQKATVDSSSSAVANVENQPVYPMSHCFAMDAVFHTTEDAVNYDEGEGEEPSKEKEEVAQKPSAYEQEGILEAKATDLRKVGDVDKGVGQLLAQMLDILKRKKSKKRTASNVSSSSAIESDFIVKGILSSSQHYLFFILREEENSLPILQFLGRYTIKIFPSETGRDSGLKSGEEDIDHEEVERLLKNLLFFLVHMR